ncbi:hypothetical protein Tco_0055530, partial [Tanacetum coccineum]
MNAIYFIPLNAAEFQHPGLMERCIMVNSKKFWSSLISATARLSCFDVNGLMERCFNPSAEVAKNHLPPPSVWEGRTQEEWNE